MFDIWIVFQTKDEDERTRKKEVHSATNLVLICHRSAAENLDHIEGRHEFFCRFLECSIWKFDFSCRWADCVDEMIVFTVRCHSYPRAHALTVSLFLISSNQAIAISTSHIMVRNWFWWGMGWVTIVEDDSVFSNEEDICPCCWQRIWERLNTADLGNTLSFSVQGSSLFNCRPCCHIIEDQTKKVYKYSSYLSSKSRIDAKYCIILCYHTYHPSCIGPLTQWVRW